MAAEVWNEAERQPADDEVAFDYIKGAGFRVVWADGAIGSSTPAGHIHFALHSERPAIPQREVFKLSETGLVGNEIPHKGISRGSIVRELSCDVMMSPEVAEQLGKWLLEQAQEAKKEVSGDTAS